MIKAKILLLILLLPFSIYSQKNVNITNNFSVTFPIEPNKTIDKIKMRLIGEVEMLTFNCEEDSFNILFSTFEVPEKSFTTFEEEYNFCNGMIHGMNEFQFPGDTLKIFDIEYRSYKGQEFYIKSDLESFYNGGRIFLINNQIYIFSAFAMGEEKINVVKTFFDSFIEIDN